MIEDKVKCLWKKYAEDKNITVDQVIPMQDMYNCVTCNGNKGECPNYLDNVRYDKINGDYR